RTGRDALLGELARGFELGARRGPRLDARTHDVLDVLAPAVAGREARVLEPLGVSDRARELRELVLAHRLHDEPAVLRLEAVEDARRASLAAHAHRPEVRHDV